MSIDQKVRSCSPTILYGLIGAGLGYLATIAGLAPLYAALYVGAGMAIGSFGYNLATCYRTKS